MTMQRISTCAAAFAAVFGALTPAVAAEGRFGQALDGRINALEVPHDPAAHAGC